MYIHNKIDSKHSHNHGKSLTYGSAGYILIFHGWNKKYKHQRRS